MTLSSDSSSVMGEQPLLSVKAHVYHIDPKSKKSWIPATIQAVPVSFFFDSARTLYRIISVEGTKAVINSIVSPAMVVTKTSQKFLQWSDSRANMVYGLGFSKEEDLNLFLDKFKEVKELSQNEKQKEDDHFPVSNQGQPNGGVLITSTPHSQVRSASPLSSASSNSSPRPPTGSVTPVGVPYTGVAPHSSTLNESQLRLENEKLREALAKSSANADKWKIQLRSLEDEKVKLMKALEESHANLSRWEVEVGVYRNRVSELENRQQGSGDGLEDKDASRTEVERLRTALSHLEKRNQARESEISALTAKLDEMRVKESSSGQGSHEKLQTMESDNRALKLAISDMQEKLSRQVALNESLKAELRNLRTYFNRQLSELKKFDDKLLDLTTGNNPN